MIGAQSTRGKKRHLPSERCSKSSFGKRRIVPVPEASVPEGDADATVALLGSARPVVLRGFASHWPAAKWDLKAIAGNGADCSAAVDVQIGDAGSPAFLGYGGVLRRTPLSSLPVVAEQEMGQAIYLVQCPAWSADDPTVCPAKHVMEGLRLDGFLPKGARGGLRGRLDSVNSWVSIGDTHSNLHYDSKHGLLVVLRGRKKCEVFAPHSTRHLHAFPVSDPLRAHHAAVPHHCLACRFTDRGVCTCADAKTACCCEEMRATQGWQTDLGVGDALFIPEGWWHHIATSGTDDASAAGREVAFAVNFWWRGFAREPAAARPYALRRILSEMLASQTAVKIRRSVLPSICPAELLCALRAASSCHGTWRRTIIAYGDALPEALAEAAATDRESLQRILDSLDDCEAAILLASLDAASAAEPRGGDAAAALRKVWRVYPQDKLVAKWSRYLQSSLCSILHEFCGATPQRSVAESRLLGDSDGGELGSGDEMM